MTALNKFFLLFLVLSFCSVSNLLATEEYAGSTGQECSVCHLDSAGGGELTAAGEGYALSLGSDKAVSSSSKPSTVSRGFRLLVGYLHILFGFFWFGTILYVHLILKPGYASQGLPRGEVKLGLVSILIMGVTGAILFAYRVPDASMLVETRFGILLLLKIILYLILVCSALIAVFVIGPRLRRKHAATMDLGTGDLSLEELAQFDGKEGRAGYIAYKGSIYDVSNSTKWKNGTHMGRHLAGGDQTTLLGQAPHGEEMVLRMPKVGKLRGDEPVGLTPPQKLFYSMAYLNLGFVLLIILILACWKWL
jgi:predicted heme/steroid binding protein